MHTAAFRANALLTYAGTALAILAALASLTGAQPRCAACAGAPHIVSAPAAADLVHKWTPVLDVRLARVERLHPLESGNDEARDAGARADGKALTRSPLVRLQALLAFSIQADLSSAFSWNTKLLFVYLTAEYATPRNELNQARARGGGDATCARACQARTCSRIAPSPAGFAMGPHH